MIRRITMLLMMAVTLATVNSAFAEDGATECPISAAMKNLPQITFQVGAEQTHCSKSAGKLAEKTGSPIVYFVGKEKFENDADAKLALVEATEAMVASFAEPHTCKISGTTSIAGQETSCSKTSAKLASLMSVAMKSVKQTYSVDGEECHCPNAAAALADKSGQPKLFCVGEEKTDCKVTARLNLARAQYRAMVEALAAAEKTEMTEAKS
ncbi:MAG: hypothetical protein GXP28_00640 [Planctomycetes bacterium]|nr:hypothetical protein [Planctomycetota bacterium]